MCGPAVPRPDRMRQRSPSDESSAQGLARPANLLRSRAGPGLMISRSKSLYAERAGAPPVTSPILQLSGKASEGVLSGDGSGIPELRQDVAPHGDGYVAGNDMHVHFHEPSPAPWSPVLAQVPVSAPPAPSGCARLGRRPGAEPGLHRAGGAAQRGSPRPRVRRSGCRAGAARDGRRRQDPDRDRVRAPSRGQVRPGGGG